MLLSGLASGLEAQPLCYDRDELRDQLARKYGERRIDAQQLDERRVLELYASETTWTLVVTVVTKEKQVSCIYRVGDVEAVSVPEQRTEHDG